MNTISKKPSVTAVLYSEKDAVRFLEEHPQADRLFPLTPDARAPLLEAGLPILNTVDHYSDYGHRRVLARVRQVERIIHPVLEQQNYLGQAAKETFRGVFHLVACTAARLWYTLRGTGPWLLPSEVGWHSCETLDEAHSLLMSHIALQADPIGKRLSWDKPLFLLLTRFLNQWICRSLRKYPVLWLTGKEYGLKDLSIHALQIESETRILVLSNTYRSYFLQAIRNWKNVLSGEKNIELIVVPYLSEKVRRGIEKLVELIDDTIINQGVIAYREILFDSVIFTHGLSSQIRRIWQNIKPKALIAHQMRWLEGAVLAQVAKECGTPSILISHGSHPVCSDQISKYAHRELARGLLVSSLASQTLVQSPSAEKAAQDYLPQLRRRRYRPIMWGYRKIPSIPITKDGIRTILHAGTYKGLGLRPWIYETSDEFVEGLISLIRGIEELENTQLIIRIRTAPECSVSALKKLLPSVRNYIIKTTGSFLEDLMMADLLISFSSTTIEESLYARRPVALWGGSTRYRHLPGSKEHPTKEHRHPVYVLPRAEELSPMIKAILDVHAGAPLRDEELQSYVWPEGVPGREEFLKSVIYSD